MTLLFVKVARWVIDYVVLTIHKVKCNVIQILGIAMSNLWGGGQEVVIKTVSILLMLFCTQLVQRSHFCLFWFVSRNCIKVYPFSQERFIGCSQTMKAVATGNASILVWKKELQTDKRHRERQRKRKCVWVMCGFSTLSCQTDVGTLFLVTGLYSALLHVSRLGIKPGCP